MGSNVLLHRALGQGCFSLPPLSQPLTEAPSSCFRRSPLFQATEENGPELCRIQRKVRHHHQALYISSRCLQFGDMNTPHLTTKKAKDTLGSGPPLALLEILLLWKMEGNKYWNGCAATHTIHASLTPPWSPFSASRIFKAIPKEQHSLQLTKGTVSVLAPKPMWGEQKWARHWLCRMNIVNTHTDS